MQVAGGSQLYNKPSYTAKVSCTMWRPQVVLKARPDAMQVAGWVSSPLVCPQFPRLCCVCMSARATALLLRQPGEDKASISKWLV